MKSSAKQKNKTLILNAFVRLWIGILILVVGLGASKSLCGQASEIEIMGPAKTPFALIVNDTAYASSRSNRLITEPLEPGKTPLHIRFHDARFTDIHDTVELQSGTKHIYRLKKIVLDASDSANSLGDYLRERSNWVSRNEPAAFVLVPLETVTASEKALALKKTPVADSVPLITHAPAIMFTRDTLARSPVTIQRQNGDSTKTQPEIPVETGTSAEILNSSHIRQLKAKMKELRFEEDKMKLTNTTVGQKQLSSEQLYEIIMLFDFERSKMQLFKQYYQQITDRSNHTRIYQAFEFSSTIDELKSWVYEQSK